MTLTTHELLVAIGDVADQRYTGLVEYFADDALYYDSLFGPQVGKDAIHDFLAPIEEVVSASGVRSGPTDPTTNNNPQSRPSAAKRRLRAKP